MTEAEAWREIARRIVDGKWGQYGLCRETSRLHWDQLITDDMAFAMCERILPHLMETSSRRHGYVYPEGTEPEARALAALWLALEAEEDDA